MPEKDYAATPLSQKLDAKPGAGVVVFFTTSRAELEHRFTGLKATLGPAGGLWIAWPKKAAKIEGDLNAPVAHWAPRCGTRRSRTT